MAAFNLLPVANRQTNSARRKPPTTPKIMGVLFKELLICLAGSLAGASVEGGGGAVELKKEYTS